MNFVTDAAGRLRELHVDVKIKQALIQSSVIHADETSINIDGTKVWLGMGILSNLKPPSNNGIKRI